MAQIDSSDHTSLWTFPLEQDGWYHAHNALRADLEAFDKLYSAVSTQLAAGKPISSAQAAAAGKFLGCFLKFLHHHHYNEEEVAIPYLAAKCEVPEKVSSDHKELVAKLERWEGGMRKLLAAEGVEAQQQALQEVQASFAELRDQTLEHFREEEAHLLPLMRRHYTPKQVQKDVVAKIMKSMDSDGLGTFFRPMGRQQRQEFARQEGIPFFVRWIIFFLADKYHKKVWQPFEQQCLVVASA